MPCFFFADLKKEFMKQSSPRQKKNCLQNFDLSEHRQIISDLAIHVYHQFISVLERSLVPAIGNLSFDVVPMFHLLPR